MPYGTIKVDTVTFTDSGVDKSVSISGLVQNPTFSGNVTVTGTISGVTVTGTTASFTSGNFTNISVGTYTITSGVFSAGSETNPSITFTGDLNTGIYSPGADQVAISTGGSGRLFVDASGRVGISSAASASTNTYLQVGLAGIGSDHVLYDYDSYFANNLYKSGSSTWSRISARTGGLLRINDDVLTYSTANSGTAGASATLSERLRITSAGLVGVGASSAPGGGDSRMWIDQAGTNDYGLLINASGGVKQPTLWFRDASATLSGKIVGQSGLTLATSSSATAAITIDTSQRVGVGTTSPQSLLHIDGDATAFRISRGSAIGFLYNTGTAATDAFRLQSNGGSVDLLSPAGQPITFSAGGSEKVRITSAGLVGIGTSSPGAKLDVSGDVIFNGGGTQFPIQFANAFTPNSERADLLLSANATSNNALRVGTIASNGGVTLQGTRQNDSSQKVSLVLNPDGGSVGIGTTSPSAKLAVVYATNGIELDPQFGFVSGTIRAYDRTTSSYKTLGLTGDSVVFGISDTEKARIDSSGRLLVGTSTSASAGGGTNIQQIFSSTNDRPLGVHFGGASATGPYITLSKSRNTGYGSYTIVNNGDVLGGLIFAGDDGTDYQSVGAYIEAYVDGTPGANDLPTRLVFSTTADGASSPTERMRIAQNGVITIQNGAVAVIGTLTDGATITPDFAADCNFTVTLGGNRTIANPTNITAGQSGSIFIVQDATGSRTLSWGSSWDFPGGTAPTLSTAANAVDRIDYIVRSSTSIHTVFTANYS